MSRAVLVAVLAGACASPVHAPSPAIGQPIPPPPPGGGPRSGPPLGVFPPNATRVTGRVLAHAVKAAEHIDAQPAIEPGTRLDALTIQIQDARAARPDVAMGPAAGTIEVFSRDPLDPALVGKRIEAVITLTGTTRASRWLISDIRTLPD
jgi:hypothetical protein